METSFPRNVLVSEMNILKYFKGCVSLCMCACVFINEAVWGLNFSYNALSFIIRVMLVLLNMFKDFFTSIFDPWIYECWAGLI